MTLDLTLIILAASARAKSMLALPHLSRCCCRSALRSVKSKHNILEIFFQEMYKVAAAAPAVVCLCWAAWLRRRSIKTTDLFLAKPEIVSTKTKAAEDHPPWNKHLKAFHSYSIGFFFLHAPYSESRDSGAAAGGGFILGVYLAGVILCLWKFAKVSFLPCSTECHSRQIP